MSRFLVLFSNSRFFRLLFLFPILLFCLEPIALFDPPEGWECAFPDKLSPCVQIGFLGKGATPFRPSINLAVEEIDVDLKQYVKAVKAIHLSEKGTSWSDLGKFNTRSGIGRLTEIRSHSQMGQVKMLQLLFVKDHYAYILTGAAIKDEFLKFQEDFIKTFQSLHFIPHLFSPLPFEKQELFQKFFANLGKQSSKEEADAQWLDLQNLVVQDGKEMGNYWQILVLKQGREKLYP
ncbi:MAG TPA: hypothetical protein VLE95_08350 [Chlamydiales bacterium]|nr:hypothetical protein [Chlamydiales bacterium]